MKLALSVVQGASPHVWRLDAPPLRIGRDTANEIQILHRSVSRLHAEIAFRHGHLHLTDLHSHNGTWLNGIRVRRPVELHAGDRIQLGRVTLNVTECPSGIALDADALATASTLIEIPPAHVIGAGARTSVDPGDLIRNLEAFGRRLVSARTLDAVYDSLLNAVESALPVTRLLLILRRDPAAEPDLVAARPRIPCFGEPPLVPMDVLRMTLARGNVLLLPDARASAGVPARRNPAMQVPTAMGAPVAVDGRPVGLVYAEHGALEGGYRREHAEVLALFANMVAVRIAKSRAARVAKHFHEIQHEIDVAGQIQRWLIPSGDLRIAGYDVHAALEPCEAIGGDFYDLHPAANGNVWIVLGDVTGHGVCGAIVMSVLLSSARVLYDDCGGPAELARRLNTVLKGQGECGRYATAFVALLDPAYGALRFVNAGHPYPLVASGRRVRALESTGPVLGTVADFAYQTERATLNPGDLLAIFTDGIPEARRGRYLYGQRRVTASVRRAARCASVTEAARSLFQGVDEFLAGAPRSDDIALLMLRRQRPRAK